MDRVYLDYNATTPLSKEVLKNMMQYLSKEYGNPSSLYRIGQYVANTIERARYEVASFLGASPDEIVFTSSGTEANNIAILGFLKRFLNNKKPIHVITSMIEHSSVYNVFKYLESEGFEVTYLPVDSDGVVDLDILKSSISDRTVMISVMMVNNETGVFQPVEEISKISKEHGVIFHCDAIQGAGKVDYDVKNMDIDLCTISAHKIYGPKGVGALYIRRGVELKPLIFGGGQEFGLKSGTENVPGIVGIGTAVKNAKKMIPLYKDRVAALRDFLEEEIVKNFSNTVINGAKSKRIGNTSNISFLGKSSEEIVIALDMLGIAVSSGSACSSGAIQESRVILAMGGDRARASSAIRFSLGLETTIDDIEKVLSALKMVMGK